MTQIDPEAIPNCIDRLANRDCIQSMLDIDPDNVEQDLARLVLGLMAFLRQLMELQSIRRVEAGSLTDDQIEKLGATLMRAETAIHEVAAQFGLKPGDLSIDLGPLGKTL